MVTRGGFIVIEGADGRGKATQTKLLLGSFKRQGYRAELLSFPQYETHLGKLVSRYLSGEFGSMDALPTEIPTMLYAIDRYQEKLKINNDLNTGTWMVADRYTASNLAHQGAKLDGKERWEFIEWIELLEKRLPQPDLTIYLNVPVEIAHELIKKRQENLDLHERDIPYQHRVVEVYSQLADRKNWPRINCISGNEMRTREEIHKDIVDVVNKNLEEFLKEKGLLN